MVVIGRQTGIEDGPVASLGHYLARDGSHGAPVDLDVDRPHAGLVVGKRGSGKTYTLGVLLEELAAAAGVTPVVVDPMGAFAPLAGPESHVAATSVEPRIRADALTPRQWCEVLGLDAAGGAGALVWQAAAEATTLTEMRARVDEAEAATATRRAAANHLRLADSWGVFDPTGLDQGELHADEVTVLDLSEVASRPASVLVAAVAGLLFEARLRGTTDRLPWLLVDEAHAFTDGVAGSPLRRLFTRGRQPGVSCWLATQRPSALPAVTVSQADLLVAHRLTSRADIDALAEARPTYLADALDARLPTATGTALVVDDSIEACQTIRVRERRTPHGGATPRATAEEREPGRQ